MAAPSVILPRLGMRVASPSFEIPFRSCGTKSQGARRHCTLYTILVYLVYSIQQMPYCQYLHPPALQAHEGLIGQGIHEQQPEENANEESQRIAGSIRAIYGPWNG